MKSEHAAPLHAARSDFELLEELNRRTAGREAGSLAELDDVRSRDQYGEEAFTTLASRFGWWRREDGQWQLERTPRWTPGWIDARHQREWFDLFEAAFGYRMAEPLWRWKYRNDPLLGMGAWRDKELVAFYGAMPRRVIAFGIPQTVVQIGDVMVHPRERGVLTRSGPYQLAASMYVERRAGYGRPYAFGFGFPTDKALKVAEKLGLYEQVDRIDELSWTPERYRGTLLHRVQPLREALSGHVDRLWQSMAARFTGSVIGVRDWRYVQERYLSHPVNRYECLLVGRRIGGRPQGVVVFRDREGDGVELLDLIADPSNFPLLLRVVRDWAARRGRPRVFMWITQSHASWLAATEPRQAPLDLMVPAMVWDRGPTGEELRGKWWLTGGDADFR